MRDSPGIIREANSRRRSMVLWGLVAALTAAVACSGIGRFTYNPVTTTMTVEGTVSGKSKKIRVENVNCPGKIVIDDPDCGRITFMCRCGGPTVVGIECGDPVLAEIPASWTYKGGNYSVQGGVSGQILVSKAADFMVPTRGPIITDPGFTAIVVKADTLFPNGTKLDLRASFDTGGTDATGVKLKGLDAALLTFEQGNETCAKPSLEIPDGKVAPDFTTINNPANMVTVVSAAPTRTWWPLLVAIAVLVAVLVLVTRLALRTRSRPPEAS